MMIFRSYVLLCFVVCNAINLCGCSRRAVDVKGPQPELHGESHHAESIEKRAFEVLSSYYCDRGAWPQCWEDVKAFQAGRRDDASFLDTFQSAKLESSRAIVITLTYDTNAGDRRRVSFIAPPSCQEKEDKGLVSIAGGRITFRLLEGSKLMSGQGIKEYWKSPPFPDAAWMEGGGVVVALRFGDIEVSPRELNGFSESIIDAYEASVPSLRWVRKGVASKEVPHLLEHEFESDSTRGRILNYVLSTSFDNRLFAITIVGPADNAQAVERTAESVRSTLVVR